MNVTSLDGSIYIIELKEPNEFVEFQFMPQKFDWVREGTYAKIPIVGRNNSKKQLTGGEDKLSFDLDFNSLFESNKQDALNKMAWLQSLTANDGFAGSARNVAISWGATDIFRHKVWVIKRVAASASQFNQLHGYVPTQLVIKVMLELDPRENTRLDDIRINSFPLGGKSRIGVPIINNPGDVGSLPGLPNVPDFGDPSDVSGIA